MKKTIFFYPVIFFINSLICLAFLMLVSMIPQERIEANAKKSAEYFMGHSLFEICVGDFLNFKADNYADCISTSIAYHFGEYDAYGAIMRADYNYSAEENVNTAFYDEMSGAKSQTQSYSRYWHGSAGIIRFLLLFTDIAGIRCIVAVAGIVLNGFLVIELMRNNHKEAGIIYGVSFLAVNGLFALNCLEYAFVFCIVPITCLFLLFHKNMRNGKCVGLLFLTVGMFTAFFDFLTTETLTLTIPLMIYYMTYMYGKPVITEKHVKNGLFKKKEQWIIVFKSSCSWVAGYAGMFLLKWTLAFFYLGKDVFYEAFEAVRERMGTDLGAAVMTMEDNISHIKGFGGILLRNLGCLYWGSSDLKVSTVWMITIIAAVVLFAFWFITRKEKETELNYLLLLFLAVIPYIRYAVLFNHSFIHYFFTYRAQMVTVMVVLYILYQSTWLSEWCGKRRRSNERKNSTCQKKN